MYNNNNIKKNNVIVLNAQNYCLLLVCREYYSNSVEKIYSTSVDSSRTAAEILRISSVIYNMLVSSGQEIIHR